MAEALAVIGLGSAIIQFVDLSANIIDRLVEFQSSLDEAPQTFRDLLVQLPLLQNTLKKTQTYAETGCIDIDTQKAVLGVVEGCQWQVKQLDDILLRTIPSAGDSRFKRGMKAFKSVSQEKEVQAIVARIQQYQISLIHYQTSPATQVLPVRRKPLFTVPFEQDPRFTGRHGQINEIEKLFKTCGRVALAGLGGVGKSQIAIEYCYRYRKSYPQSTILWMHASNVERIDQAYKEIARRAELSGWQDPKTNKFDIVESWLSQEETGRWLIVLDNADDEDVFFGTEHMMLSGAKGKSIATYIPHSKEGSVLITTRDRRIGRRLANRVQPIDVPPFHPQDSLALFESLVGQTDSADEGDVSQLLEILAHLPLAISQAAAFITENSITVPEYLELLREGEAGMKELLSEELTDDRRDRGAQNSVIRTWKISFDHIRRSNPRATEILSLASILDRQGIPKWLLRSDSESSIEFTKAIGTLQAFSLITTENSQLNIEVHRLVHLATQKWLELRGEIKQWRDEALKVVSEHYPVGAFENWAVCNALTAHVQAVVEYGTDSESSRIYAARILTNAVFYDVSQGRYEVASDKCMSVLAMQKILRGPEHPDTLTSMGNLASTYRIQGRWAEAEALNVQVLETRKRVLGAEHPDTLTNMANLASTYRNQGRWAEAEALEVQVIETRKRVLGAEHPDTLVSIGNLASTYWNQGRWAEAEALGVQVMDTRKRVLGAEHPDTLMSMGNLASTYRNQGRWAEAEALGVQVLETRKRVLGAEHPSTLTTMANLASTYRHQGRWAEAEALEVQVIETQKRVLGAEHPDTLVIIGNLASTYWNQGRLTEAEALGVQVMETQKRVLGAEHPRTLTSMANLASTYRNQGRWAEAEALNGEVLKTRKRVLEAEHPNTLTSMANLALTYSDQGRWAEAEAVGLQVTEARKRVLGAEHPDTLTSMANLALTYSDQGRLAEAEVVGLQVIEIQKRVLGAEHPDTLTSKANLASTYSDQGRLAEAEAVGLQVIEIRKRVLGAEHPDTLKSMANLASTYQNQGRWAEAETLEVQVMDTGKRVLGAEHPDTLTSMGNLASTYLNQGQYADAEALEVQVVETRKRVLGPEHPDTLTSMANLAATLKKQGRNGEAIEMLALAAELRRRILGPEHPKSITADTDLRDWQINS